MEYQDKGKIAEILKALANENRLAIFEYLRQRHAFVFKGQGTPSVGEIASEFDLALSTVSHHLKELYRAGLITCERRGKHVFCVVNQAALEALEGYFAR